MSAGIERVTAVLGGGGVWGGAWMTGVIKGLSDAGIDMRKTAALIGTSAGSMVGAQLGACLEVDELFDRQVRDDKQTHVLDAPGDAMGGLRDIHLRQWQDPGLRVKAIRQLAGSASTVSLEERKANILERLGLPTMTWPDKPLRITAADVDTGELRVFDRDSGVGLLDAVTASCAVPGVWPTVSISGRRYIDGGVCRSSENANLAVGSSAVLILSPVGRLLRGSNDTASVLSQDIEALIAAGAKVALIAADEASVATMQPGILNPATRKPAAEAGRRQAQHEAATVDAAFA